MAISVGNKVLITQDAYDNETAQIFKSALIDATKGSIGRVITIYRNGDCLIEFETVESCHDSVLDVACEVGSTVVLDSRFFQKIE